MRGTDVRGTGATLAEKSRPEKSHCETARFRKSGPSVRSFRQAEECLARLPIDGSDVTRTQNLSVIETLGRPDNAAAMFRYILNDRSLLDRIAGRSYRHTNHFDKIVLLDSGDPLGYRLTLHLWTPPYAEPEIRDEQIHDHRFSFWSNILVGEIVFQNYVRDATGIMFREYQYIPEKVETSTTGNFYVDVGQSPLLETAQSAWKAGQCYYLPYYRIHRAMLPLTETACTLVLRGPRQKNYASVFSNSQKYAPSTNTMFSPTVLAEKLSRLLDGLRREGHA